MNKTDVLFKGLFSGFRFIKVPLSLQMWDLYFKLSSDELISGVLRPAEIHLTKFSSTRRYLQANKRAFSEEDCKVAPCTRCSRLVAACKNRSEES